MKSQLSAHKFCVQKCRNIEATGPPSWTYPRTRSFVAPDADDDNAPDQPSVGMTLEVPHPHQPSCIATVTSILSKKRAIVVGSTFYMGEFTSIYQG